MKFEKYSSIENSYRNRIIKKINKEGLDKEKWSVSEKVHGSNLSIWFDGNEIKLAKRSNFINDNGMNFFRADIILLKYGENIKQLFNDIKEGVYKNVSLDEPIENIAVYGEIFGGQYNHPEVEKIDRVPRVQKGVEYSPDIDFYVFDIKINEKYVSVDEMTDLCEKYKLFYAKELFRGGFEECLGYCNNFNSKIPEWLGLPLLNDNICEGVVIKTIKPKFLWGQSRAILKNKNEKWSEKSKKSKKSSKSKKEINLSKEALDILEELKLYITENRLKNVISKIGTITDKHFGILIKDMSNDIIGDYEKDHEEGFANLDSNEEKLVIKEMKKHLAEFIRSRFCDIIDGEF